MTTALAYAAIYLIWGSTYLAIRVAVLVAGSAPGQINVAAASVLVAGTLTWAAGSLYSRPPRLPASVSLGAGMPLLLGGAMLLAASFVIGEPGRYDTRDLSRASLW